MAARFRAAFDGGSRGNPGPAAWGVAIFDEHDECTGGHSGALGRATNNVAEYHGLLEALKLAEEHGAEAVDLRADSELIVRQVEGRYRVRNAALRPLYEEAMRRIRRFKSFRLRHVRREFNKDADRLVNAALDRATESSEAPAP